MIDNNASNSLRDLFDSYLHEESSVQDFELMGQEFEVTHVKTNSKAHDKPTLNYCAAGRVAHSEQLSGTIPGLFSEMSDDRGQFTYKAYLTSTYLNERVTSERMGFHIEDKTEGIFAGSELSFDGIREKLFPLIQNFLADSLEKNVELAKEKLQEFVAHKSPKYRPLLRNMAESKLAINPSISERDLELHLHRELFEFEHQILDEGQKLVSEDQTLDGYAERLESYLKRFADLKQSDLANYAVHRRVVIDLLEYVISEQNDGTFEREDVIHNLILPLGITSSDLEYRHQNLWLLDERLAFHHYLASDVPLASNPTTSDQSRKKPDIATLKTFEKPMLFGELSQEQASITVVEIKRPMRKDFSAGIDPTKDPITQALDYLRRLRKGAKDLNGRSIPNAETIPGYVYVLADLNEPMVACCKFHRLIRTADGMGYFGYHSDPSYNAFIQVISFHGLIKSARERHAAFFDQLNFPTRSNLNPKSDTEREI